MLGLRTASYCTENEGTPNKAEEARGAAILELAELKGRLRAMEQQLVTLQESRQKVQAERPRQPSRMKPLVKRRTLR